VFINSAFQVGLAGLGLLRNVLVVAFLTRAEYGLWGILIATILSLTWLMQLGIGDKYIQQAEEDQEHAYQKAFTLKLAVSCAFVALVAVLLPLYALAYGRTELIVPGVVLALAAPISAFQAPIWIAYRRMQFVRQRVLTAVDPIVALIVTIVLGAAGFGYWCLVIGAVAGTVAGAIVATVTCPYPNRLRYDRGTLAEYTKFSWPLVGFGLSNMITVQGLVLIADHEVGLAGVGAIGLAVTIASFADRVDGIVSQTIYPAVCAVADRTKLLHEAFVKSNRVILMWAIPFAVGLALFADDLVTYVLGEKWRSEASLIAAVGLIVGLTQIAFNWSIFMRAVNYTKPIFFAALLNLTIFATVMVPALLTLGLDGYILGLGVSVASQILLRGYFLARLFPGFHILRHSIRAIAPSIPAAGIVLLLRIPFEGRSLGLVLGELVLYAALTILFTLIFERRLVDEMVGYVKGAARRGAAVKGEAVASPHGSRLTSQA
jgi:O-antigen/teichoic acid export membrane protein